MARKQSNAFAKSFIKRSPLKEDIVKLPTKEIKQISIDTKEPELAKVAKFEDTEYGKKQAKKQAKKQKRKEFRASLMDKANEIGMGMLNAPSQKDPSLNY